MPEGVGGKRPRKKKRGGFRFGKWAKQGINAGAGYLARQAYKGVKYLKELVNAEAKFIDVNNTVSPSTSGTVQHLSPIAQGDTVSQRSGQSVFLKSLFCQMLVQGNSANTINYVRIMIVRDSMNMGTTPASTDILQVTGSSSIILSPLLNTAHGRFSVLYDRLIAFTSAGSLARVLKFYMRIKKHVKYTGAASTDEWKNQLYILMCSDVSVNNPSVTYYSRLRFYDN